MTDDSATSVEVECVYDNGCGRPAGECAVQCKAVLDALAFAARRSSQTERPFGDRHGPTPEEARRMLDVQGHCPACGSTTLFLADGGHVTCSRDDCPNPSLADDLLRRGRPAPGAWLTEGTRDLSIPQQTPRFTARPVIPEIEAAATERATQAAEASEQSAAWFAAHSSPDTAEQRLAYLRGCATRLRGYGASSMAVQFVLDVIDGREEPVATEATDTAP